MENLIGSYRWLWSLSEILHFTGLILLVGIISIYDLRLLGIGKRIPVAALNRLLPWAVFGFCLCVLTGLLFVTGLWANVKTHPMEALVYDHFLQIKLAFIVFAGLNLLFMHKSGMATAVDELGPGDEAPALARVIAASSLVLWLGVVYFGRLVPWGL
mgnify:FL=1